LKVNKNGVISAINLSSEEAYILAPKIKLEGLVTANSYFKVLTDGSIEATNAVISGKITATSGEIGGWKVDAGKLYSGSGANRVALSTSDATYAIWAGNETAANAPFRVGKNGSLFASNAEITGKIVSTNADITGKITSSSGSIGGWTLATGYIYSGSGTSSVYLSTTDSTYRIWAGNATASSAPFRVGKNGSLYASNAEITGKITSTNADITGKITASSGAIGGWNIGTNLLYAGSGSNRVALSTGDATYAMWAGNETAANAPFRVTKDGKVYLTRVMALANEGDTTPTEVNLSSVSFWKLNRAVKTLSVSDDTLTIALYNGTSVNFKKASSVEYMHISQTGGGSNNVDLTVTAKSKTQEILKSRSISLTCDATNKWVWISSPDDSGSFSGYVNCSEIYDAGEDSVSVNSLSTAYMGYPGNIDVTVKLSNGKSRTITTADGGVFNIGLKAASPTATITYDSSTHKYKIEPYTQYVGDTSVTTGAAKYTGTEAYKAGWDAAVAKIERDGNVIKGPSSTVDEQTNLFTITAGGSLNNITNTAANYFNVNGYAYAYINDINVASKFISKANQINVGQ